MGSCVYPANLPSHPHSAPLVEARFGTQFQLRPNQSAHFNNQFQVQFLAISEDSRCPTDALCIQPGEAIAEFQLSQQDQAQQVRLTLKPAQVDLAITEFQGHTLQLLEVHPQRITTQSLDPADYTVTLVVSVE